MAATTFEALEAEADQLALRGGGLYLCAELDGRVTHSRRDCGAWERFRPVGATAPAPLQAIFPGSVSARYHLGCGPFVIPGFLNLDQLADMPEGQVFANFGSVPGAFFANCDLSRGIPGRDNSLEVVYHCHFLEHLTYGDAIKLLRQARLRLKPGGLMRVVVPDLELWIDNYRINNTAFFDDYRRLVLGNNVGLYRTKGAVFMGMLHNHGHKCGYDFETLSWLLHELGFANIRRTGFREGSMPDLLTAEPDRLLRSMESLCIECEKPPLAGPEPVGIDAAIG